MLSTSNSTQPGRRGLMWFSHPARCSLKAFVYVSQSPGSSKALGTCPEFCLPFGFSHIGWGQKHERSVVCRSGTASSSCPREAENHCATRFPPPPLAFIMFR